MGCRIWCKWDVATGGQSTGLQSSQRSLAAELVGHPLEGVCRENSWVRFHPLDRDPCHEHRVTESSTGCAFGAFPLPEQEVSRTLPGKANLRLRHPQVVVMPS